MASNDTIAIRAATAADTPGIFSFIKALADYENLAHAVTGTETMLREALFGPRPFAEALMASCGEVPAGFALFFHTFSTFRGQPSLYLEDLYVDPDVRGRGIGKALLGRVAKIAVERGCGRLEWSVLDWNAPSIAFYESLGARRLDDWTMYRLTGEALLAAAAQI